MTAAAIFPIILLAIIVIGVTIFVAYNSAYKKNINRALEENESTAHNPMAPSESIGKVILIVGLIIVAFSTISALSSISNDLISFNNNLHVQIGSLYDKIDELEDKMVQMELEAQSLVSSLEYKVLGNIDTKNHTADVYISCIAKEYTDETEISVTFGGNTIKLKNEGGIFTGIAPVKMFERLPDQAVVSLTENGVTRTSKAVGTPTYFLYYEALPWLGSPVSCGTGYSKNEIEYDCIFDISDMDDFSDIKVMYYLGDTLLKTQDVTSHEVVMSGKQKVQDGEFFKIIVEGTDKYGYVHRSLVFASAVDGDEVTEQAYMKGDGIFDKSGNLLCNEFME